MTPSSSVSSAVALYARQQPDSKQASSYLLALERRTPVVRMQLTHDAAAVYNSAYRQPDDPPACRSVPELIAAALDLTVLT